MFEKVFRIVSIAVFAILLAGAAVAGEWRIARSVGAVSVTSGGTQPVSLGSASSVPDGATVVTGARGRVLLVRGSESMTVGPNSMVIVPASRNGQTTILQRAGDILFDVDRRRVRHFSVETPNLAAVVKGTDFQVSVSPTQSVVIVHSGIVEVTGLAAGQAVDLTAGQRAGVRGRGPLTLSDPSLQVRQVTPRAPVSLPATTAAIDAGVGTGAAGATVGASIGGGGVNAGAGASVGGSSVGASASVGAGGASASVGAGGGSVSASAGGGGVSASVDSGAGSVSASAGDEGISASVDSDAGSVSVSAGDDGVGVSVGGLDIGIGN